MIYQMHEHHGRHIAYSPMEAESNNKNGWVNVSKEEYYDIGEKDDFDDVGERIELAKQYIEKFGKKPHFNMKTENIRKALDGGTE